MIYAVCALVSFVGVVAFYDYSLGWWGIPFLESPFASVIGLGLPLFFNIKDKGIRNIGLTICILTMFLRMRWIGLGCLLITCAVVSIRKKMVFILIPIALIIGCFIYPKLYKSPCSKTVLPVYEFNNRIDYYKFAIGKWKHILTGEGFRAWSKLPENQIEAVSPIKAKGKWLHTLHSDLLQFMFEFGVIAGFIAVFLLLLPIFYVNLNLLVNRTILASYFCLLFQACVDFPFHRAITGVFGVWLILMMYKQAFLRGKNEVNSFAN